MTVDLSDLKTGDLILCNYEGKKGWFNNIFDKMIKWGSHSNWTHCAMILKDPTFISPGLRGLYVWESSENSDSDSQCEKKFGVHITPLSKLLNNYKGSGSVIVRPIHSKLLTNKNLTEIYKLVYDKEYDLNIIDWFEAFIKEDFTKKQKTDRFWCSALVACIYTKCGILDKDTDWSIVAPNDFDISVTNQLTWTEGNYLEPIEKKII